MRPHVFRGLWCRCGAQHYQEASYYVSVVNDPGHHRHLLGPFQEHDEALAHVERARRLAEKVDVRAIWYRYGTLVVKPGKTPPVFGLFNGVGLVNAGALFTLTLPRRSLHPWRRARRMAQWQ